MIELARHGAEVILGARNPAKLEASIRTIEKEVPGAALHPLSIDVSDLSSVRRAASQVDGAARPADQQRRRDGHARTSARPTGWSCRWPPTTSDRSR